MKTNVKLNIATSLILQFVSALCSFVMPQFLIPAFGSTINGTITTITQIMGFLGLLEAGIGSVAYVALYNAFASGDNCNITIVRNTIRKYYYKISVASVLLCLVIACFLPVFLNNGQPAYFNIELCLIIGCGHFIQYYFGITNMLLLNADFKGYINSVTSIISTVLNCVLIVILIKLNCGVLAVKLLSAIILFIRPIMLNIYVKAKYDFENTNAIDNKLLAQRWSNLGHTIAFYVHGQTDTVLIMLFLNVAENSVYGLYLGIVNAIKMVVNVILTNYNSILGRICAEFGSGEKTQSFFKKYCNLSNYITNTLFATLLILIIPFMKVYTENFTDYSYIRPVFAYLLCVSEYIYLLRFPYHTLINVKGHFKQTQIAAYLEAGLNIIISVILIDKFGIAGVVVGTTIAMLFRYIYIVIYVKKKLLNYDMKSYIKSLLEVFVNIVIIVICSVYIDFSFINSYLNFIVSGFILVIVIALINFIVHFVLFRENALKLINYNKM